MAEEAVTYSFQNSFVKNVMSAVAPLPDEEDANGDEPQIMVKDDEVSLLSNTDQATTKAKLSGSTNLSSSFPGILYIKLIRANVMNKNFPPETDMNDVLKSHSSMSSANDSFHLEKNPSDYYIRISWTGSGEKSVRTETIYHTSNPRFDGKEMEFEVSHHGMEFKLELIDANSDEANCPMLINQ